MTWTPPKCPLLAVDVVVRYPDGRFVAIERKFPPLGLALPGGFVDVGESCEDAAKREIKEELNLEIENLLLLGVWSKPDRDPRRHVVSVAYQATPVDPMIMPKAGDDARTFMMVHERDYNKLTWCFDHKDILGNSLPDYEEWNGNI